MARRSLLIVTSTRAEYGVLRSLIRETAADPGLELRLLVTGAHLSAEHGHTVREIEADGIPIWRRQPVQVAGGEEVASAQTIGVALLSASPALAAERPDILVLCGDRTEAIAFGLAALVLRIPLAHLHGGEITAGAIDEAVRHALTKIAAWHFAATREAAGVIAQLGEEPQRIFTVGAPALDRLAELEPLPRETVCARLGLDPGRPAALVTFHPPTASDGAAADEQAAELLAGLERSDLQAVFTAANADAHGDRINERFQAAAAASPERYRFSPSLGGELYFSCLARLDLMLGNSSSGLIEAPSFGLPVVNVGDRQEGRPLAANVIPAAADRGAVAAAIARARSEEFRRVAGSAVNPYAPHGIGAIGRRIKETLKSVPLGPDAVRKRFVLQQVDHAQAPRR